MGRKTEKKTETGASVENEIAAEEVKAVSVRIRREHILAPHSIELRRNGGETVVEARIEDHRHSETIGAKTVQEILDENGAGQDLQSDDEQLEITFSPITGEVVSILPFAEKIVAAENVDEKNTEG